MASLLLTEPPARLRLSQNSPALRRVLIVSPHFAPTNGADHHRVRMALPYFHQNGWKVEFLAVDPAFVESDLDPELEASLPAGTRVHRCHAVAPQWTRRFGFGNLGWRAYFHLRQRGHALLSSGRFDLVFFSTTQFGFLSLALEWKKRHGLPYVIDLQDEWVSHYYRDRPHLRPPGGRFKYALDQALARWNEARVMNGAAQIVSVSPRYLGRLWKRCPGLQADRLHVLPFGAAKEDFNYLIRARIQQPFFDPQRGMNWVYVGRGGTDTHFAAAAFFDALRDAVATGRIDRDKLRIHFIGTDYAPPGLSRATFAPLAAERGLTNMVREHPGRVPYFTALRCLHDADALLIPGSDEPGYMASKLFSYLFAHRPLLALFHEKSPNVKLMGKLDCATLIAFRPGLSRHVLSSAITARWFMPKAFDRHPPFRAQLAREHDAEAMTQKLALIFDQACRESACA